MSNRRKFLQQSFCASGALLCGMASVRGNESSARTPRHLRLLILGGTGYIGPHFVRAAVARGHEVTIFNRGVSQADLPQAIERLRGDRNGKLEALKGRDWDAAIDLATYTPQWVRSLGEALKDHVGQYTLISSSAVYDNTAPGQDLREDSPVQTYRGSEDPYSVGAPSNAQEYAALKVLCEREAERQFFRRTLVLRPSYIVGPGDPQAYFTYWPARIAREGEMVVAGEPSMAIQFIDVRDLAEWALRMIERRATGICNSTGPAALMTLEQLIQIARASVVDAARPTWVPSSWLAAQKDPLVSGKLLFWSEWAWSMRMSTARARREGLAIRPVKTTLADTFEWYAKQPLAHQSAILTTWRSTDNGPEAVATTWDVYLEREKQVLAAWHAHQRVSAG